SWMLTAERPSDRNFRAAPSKALRVRSRRRSIRLRTTGSAISCYPFGDVMKIVTEHIISCDFVPEICRSLSGASVQRDRALQ
ncbi:hypothetical protein, partial [Nocardia violaceofusca]|uniref:hypothetical protein n=1 Tax=Nocardia violaceofusca TaxID=941182 RepID=UPI001E5E401E